MTAKKIIVGYDQSPDAIAAAAWALDEATRTGALVEFFYAYEWPTWAPAASIIPSPAVWPDGETDRAIRGMLDEAVTSAKLSHPGVGASASIVNAPAALTLRDRSAEASLIVLGSRGHNAIASVGSVSVSVTAHAHCPVIVVRGDPAPDAPIVVGVDDSGCAELALTFAFEQAASRGVPLRVIRAWNLVTGLWEDNLIMTDRVVERENGLLRDLVAVWQQKHPGVEVSTTFVPEHPAQALTSASAGAQLVVVGSRGRGAFLGMVLGSVSQSLLHHAPCTVAVVREIPQS